MIFYPNFCHSFDNGQEKDLNFIIFMCLESDFEIRSRMDIMDIFPLSKQGSVKLEQQGPLLKLYWTFSNSISCNGWNNFGLFLLFDFFEVTYGIDNSSFLRFLLGREVCQNAMIFRKITKPRRIKKAENVQLQRRHLTKKCKL